MRSLIRSVKGSISSLMRQHMPIVLSSTKIAVLQPNIINLNSKVSRCITAGAGQHAPSRSSVLHKWEVYGSYT